MKSLKAVLLICALNLGAVSNATVVKTPQYDECRDPGSEIERLEENLAAFEQAYQDICGGKEPRRAPDSLPCTSLQKAMKEATDALVQYLSDCGVDL